MGQQRDSFGRPANECWNWIMVNTNDRSSSFGPGFADRPDAIADTKQLIDLIVEKIPAFAPHAQTWLAGQSKDDTVHGGGIVFGLYSYDGSQRDNADQANLWMVDFAGRAGAGLTRP